MGAFSYLKRLMNNKPAKKDNQTGKLPPESEVLVSGVGDVGEGVVGVVDELSAKFAVTFALDPLLNPQPLYEFIG